MSYTIYIYIKLDEFKKNFNTIIISVKCALSKALSNFLLSPCHRTMARFIYRALHRRVPRQQRDVMRKRNELLFAATTVHLPILLDTQ